MRPQCERYYVYRTFKNDNSFDYYYYMNLLENF